MLTRTVNRKLKDERSQPKGSVGIASCSNQTSDVAKPVLSEDASVAVAFVGKILNYSPPFFEQQRTVASQLAPKSGGERERISRMGGEREGDNSHEDKHKKKRDC